MSPIELFWTAKNDGFLYQNEIFSVFMIFRGTGAGQHYFVAFLSLLSPQARGASVMSLLFQRVLKGICDEFMAI